MRKREEKQMEGKERGRGLDGRRGKGRVKAKGGKGDWKEKAVRGKQWMRSTKEYKGVQRKNTQQ